MKNYIKIITGILLFFCAIQLKAQQPEKPLVRFGLIADIQYCDCETANNRYYRKSLRKLDECVQDLNSAGVQFTINVGDLVDRDTEANIDEIMKRLDKLENKYYNTTGNHDYGGVTDNKALYQRLKMPAEYYTFEYENWVFIMLNTNEISSYSNTAGTAKEEELTALTSALKKERRRNGASYNGGISKEQMKWLEKELTKAQQEGKNVMIFSHHPFYPDNGLTAFNDRDILELLSRYSCVKASIAGHHHPGHFGEYNGIPFITTQGMIETENENAYGIVELFSHKIVITGKGRTRSYELDIKHQVDK